MILLAQPTFLVENTNIVITDTKMVVISVKIPNSKDVMVDMVVVKEKDTKDMVVKDMVVTGAMMVKINGTVIKESMKLTQKLKPKPTQFLKVKLLVSPDPIQDQTPMLLPLVLSLLVLVIALTFLMVPGLVVPLLLALQLLLELLQEPQQVILEMYLLPLVELVHGLQSLLLQLLFFTEPLLNCIDCNFFLLHLKSLSSNLLRFSPFFLNIYMNNAS